MSSLRRNSSLRSACNSVVHSLVVDADGIAGGGGGEGGMLTPPPQGKRRKRQKSVFQLLRSTRQSNKPSIVQRNGDVIIMKGGKIVSVRRRDYGPGTESLHKRLQAISESGVKAHGIAAGLAGPGNVMCGVAYDVVTERAGETDSQQSDEVFDSDGNDPRPGRSRKVSPLNNQTYKKNTYSNDKGSDNNTGHDTSYPESKLDECDSGIHIQQNSIHKNNGRSRSKEELTFSFSRRDSSPSFRKSSVPLISLGDYDDDDDRDLATMPLSPRSRDLKIYQSDNNISPTGQNSQGNLKINAGLPISRSSSHIFNKPQLQRLPSVEFLGPPISIKKSLSAVSLKIMTGLSRSRTQDSFSKSDNDTS